MMTTLLTVKDVATRIHVKEKTVYAWASQGKIPCLKVNGIIRFETNAIDRWLEGCRLQVGAQARPSFGKRKGSRSEIDRAIARVKREVYTSRHHGETRPTSGSIGKEVSDGAV